MLRSIQAMKIDLTVEKDRRQRAIQRVRERNIIIPPLHR
jgi:hypothetical protein